MRHVRARHSIPYLAVSCLGLCCLALVAGCTIAPPPGTPVSPSAEVLPADQRTLAYGATTEQVLRNPEMGEKIHALFGPDWMPATQSRGQLVPGAAAYFERGAMVRMLRIGGTDYIAVPGCVPAQCDTRHVLLLIKADGSQLLARLDEGGFVHYYGYGSEGVLRDTAPPIVDSAFRALYRSGSGYPGARS